MKLVEINTNMGKDVYEMFQDIPKIETGSYNACFGLTYNEYKEYLKKEVNRKNNKITLYDTPTISYILYDKDKPIGLLGLRLEIDEMWKKRSGNFYYKIRMSERNKGYGKIILKLGLKKLKKLGFNEVYGESSLTNIASIKVIESNGGILYKSENDINYYKIKL